MSGTSRSRPMPSDDARGAPEISQTARRRSARPAAAERLRLAVVGPSRSVSASRSLADSRHTPPRSPESSIDGFCVPMVHVLHCPPFDVLQRAHESLSKRQRDRRVVAVSGSLASAWASTATGPVHDRTYFESAIAPRLSSGRARWVGPLDTPALRRLFDVAAVGVVTPMWAEPFGLVAAEMLASGLPIAAFDSGAIREFTDPAVAALVEPGDDDALTEAIGRASGFDRAACRAWATQHLSLAAMTATYVGLYREAIPNHRRAAFLHTRDRSTG